MPDLPSRPDSATSSPHDRPLPSRPDIDQLRRRAKDLLRAARAADPTALAQVATVSERLTLASAQLAVAREHGFPSWPALAAEVVRRLVLDRRDLAGLAALLAKDGDAAHTDLTHWRDHPLGASPLGYVAMLRFDTSRHVWRDVPGTGPVARALLEAGAPVDGDPGTSETPLMTAASYGDAEVARVLVEAGAALEASASPDTGGVPGGTALLHAAVFGMTDVVDVLVAAGARVGGLVVAAAAGDVSAYDLAAADPEDRVLALVMAADHQREQVIDALVDAGTPVDAVDAVWGRQALRVAAENGRARSVRRLLARGADPDLRDERGRRPLDLCRSARRGHEDTRGHDEVEAVLVTVTSGGPDGSPRGTAPDGS